MDDFLAVFGNASFWAATLRIATPLIFGTIGALISERTGVVNLGIEGIMVFGAMAGWMAVYHGGDLWAGAMVATFAGIAFGLLHGVLTVWLGLSQHVTGIGITMLATSLSYFIFRILVPETAKPTIEAFAPLEIPFFSDIPFLGAVLAPQTALTYLALAIALFCGCVLYLTPLGLALRLVGENPAAAAAQGINVVRLRIGAVAVGAGLMGLAGAFLTMSAFNGFNFNMVNGRGWICIALVVFASWKPGRAVAGALLFAAADALQLRLQQIVPDVPYQVFLMMPYVLSIAALITMTRRAVTPRALMIPYRKGQR